eukprot:761735-Hanusia_phi.AAC.2
MGIRRVRRRRRRRRRSRIDACLQLCPIVLKGKQQVGGEEGGPAIKLTSEQGLTRAKTPLIHTKKP